MCHSRWTRRSEREAEESREVWLDFDRATPLADPAPATDEPEPEPDRAEAPEIVAAADR